MRRNIALPRRLALASALLLAGCGQPAKLAADRAWVRLPAVPGAPAAGYLTIHGGATEATLVGIATPAARNAELHETMAMGSGAMGSGGGTMTTMAPLARIAVPAKGEVAFAPGGRHVMLFGIGAGVKPGATLPLVLSFADGRHVTAHALTIAAGDPAPQ